MRKCRVPTGLRLRMAWNWCTWLLLVLLLFMQVLAVMWPTVKANVHVVFGQEPHLGKYTIPGSNDDPYSDRSIVCKRRGRQYVPMQLSLALANQRRRPASTANVTSNGIDAYRVIPREEISFTTEKLAVYAAPCSILAEKLARIFDICASLGYANVTRDVLRVIDGTDADRATILPDTLPVLLLPYWDFGVPMRLAIPSTDGSACVFRISFGVISLKGRDMSMMLTSTPRRNREATTARWLGAPTGVWRNGWFEDPRDGSRWYSDVLSNDPSKPYECPWYDFDLASDTDWMQANDCSLANVSCDNGVRRSSWGSLLTIDFTTTRVTSIAISNEVREGFFMFEATGQHIVKSIYSLEKFVSNVTLAGLAFQWLVAMISLSKAHESIGVGALAEAMSFKALPLLLLPRLNSTFEGFWTAGCRFEGDQIALSESWSVMYPAIGEFVLVYFSLLNNVAKLTRRRVSDALFGPTLLFFALLHYSRDLIAQSDLFGFDGRVTTFVTATEVEDASLLAFFTTDLAFRVNGRVTSLFAIKIAVLVLNLIPLLVGSRRVANGATKKYASGVTPLDGETEMGPVHTLETAFAMRFACIGGLGLSLVYSPHPTMKNDVVVVPCELVRAGYLVVDSASQSEASEPHGFSKPSMVIVSINTWCWLLAVAPVSDFVDQIVMPRVLTFGVSIDSTGDSTAATSASVRVLRVDPEPRYCRPGDLHLQQLQVRKISAWATH